MEQCAVEWMNAQELSTHQHRLFLTKKQWTSATQISAILWRFFLKTLLAAGLYKNFSADSTAFQSVPGFVVLVEASVKAATENRPDKGVYTFALLWLLLEHSHKVNVQTASGSNKNFLLGI